FGAKRHCPALLARYIVCGWWHHQRRVLRACARCDLAFPGRTTRTTPRLRRLIPTRAGSGNAPWRGDTQGGEEPMEDVFDVLAELNQLDGSQPGFEERLSAFTRAAREHFDFEERHVWPRLRSVLTAKAADALAGRILAARQTVPAPPFPRASASSS